QIVARVGKQRRGVAEVAEGGLGDDQRGIEDDAEGERPPEAGGCVGVAGMMIATVHPLSSRRGARAATLPQHTRAEVSIRNSVTSGIADQDRGARKPGS